VYGLAESSRFHLRYDVPARCADLLHEGRVDLGLIPSIEYLRSQTGDRPDAPDEGYCIVPDVAIASHGAVASVALFTKKPVARIASIALDTSSRTSVALVHVLCRKAFGIRPSLEPSGPGLDSMLARCDAALLIGDGALLIESRTGGPDGFEKIDLGQVWTETTGLPFVYAFWAGRPGIVTPGDVGALQRARDAGVAHADEIAGDYFTDPRQKELGAAYLRHNIKYRLGAAERAGLELFYRYAQEVGVVERTAELRFYAEAPGTEKLGN
jgi:chorismate dehydratase